MDLPRRRPTLLQGQGHGASQGLNRCISRLYSITLSEWGGEIRWKSRTGPFKFFQNAAPVSACNPSNVLLIPLFAVPLQMEPLQYAVISAHSLKLERVGTLQLPGLGCDQDDTVEATTVEPADNFATFDQV
jgi:hypothetical protein